MQRDAGRQIAGEQEQQSKREAADGRSHHAPDALINVPKPEDHGRRRDLGVPRGTTLTLGKRVAGFVDVQGERMVGQLTPKRIEQRVGGRRPAKPG